MDRPDAVGNPAPATDRDTAPGALLRLLADGQRRSRATLARVLDWPEADVAATLTRLTSLGMQLDEAPQGIALKAFVPLDAGSIEAICMAHRVDADVLVETLIGSTNTRLLEDCRAERLGDAMTVLAAELQHAGRGRLGRVWYAAPGSSLTVSFALMLPLPLSAMSGFSLMCGLAVHDALLMHGVDAELKWPNDLLGVGGKLGGILIETHQKSDAMLCAVVGIGLNICADEGRAHALAGRETAMPPSDLCASGARHPVDRNRLIADLALSLSRRVHAFVKEGFAPYVCEWNSLHAFQGETISMIEEGALLVSGVAQGVDAAGRLLVQTAEGPRTVVAGDVSVRPGP
jgi:BirA family biotin operon repressor/biotin-[acetyl-CoA-carboxylase] ligase